VVCWHLKGKKLKKKKRCWEKKQNAVRKKGSPRFAGKVEKGESEATIGERRAPFQK